MRNSGTTNVLHDYSTLADKMPKKAVTIEKLDDANAREPMDLRYMKMVRNLQHLIGSWPHAAFGQAAQPLPLRSTGVLALEWSAVLLGGLVYIRTHFSKVTFFEMGHCYLTVFMNVVGVQRVLIPWVHRKTYPEACKLFVCEMHLMHHRHKTPYSEEVYQRIYRLCTIFVKLLTAEMVFGIFLFNLAPMYYNYRTGMFREDKPEGKLFEHSINYSLPFNYHTKLSGYLIVALLNLFLTYDCGLCFCGYDLLLSVIVFHIWGHLKILDNNLRTFPTPVQMREQTGEQGDELSYTEEENKRVGVMLKDIINHHRMIMGFMTTTSAAFGPMLCLYYTFHQVCGCLLLLECSRLDSAALGRYAVVTVTIFHLLIQISVIVELLGSQSETLKDAAYSLPWEYMDTSNRKIVLFLLYNVQTPITLKPMGMVSVGVKTMATILKTSISYFMLIRNHF
uniref:Odorant receptor n=1 Tax=Conogethes punctiferalis TaxID=1133088 RepID=A0A1X9PEV2_CONPF|nr:odorant receptor 1 [Conogethes punctiferalis]